MQRLSARYRISQEEDVAKKYFGSKKQSEVLVSDYIEGSRTLNQIIGSAVLLYLMADENLDVKTYKRLMTSARAIKDKDKPRYRSIAQNCDEQQYLFDDEDMLL